MCKSKKCSQNDGCIPHGGQFSLFSATIIMTIMKSIDNHINNNIIPRKSMMILLRLVTKTRTMTRMAKMVIRFMMLVIM